MSSLDTWEQLGRAGGAGSVTLVRRLFPASTLEVHLGLRQPAGQPLLFLDVDPSEVPTRIDLPPTRAIIPTVTGGPNGRARVQLALGDPALRTVFAAFVDDVAAKLEAAETDEDAVAVLVARHRQWRHLLTRGPRGMSSAEEQGLWGELWTLARIVIPWLGAEAVLSWTGPDGTRHDFQTGRVDLEVKTTRNGRPGSIRISRIDQLEAGEHPLALLAISVDASSAGSGTSVDELIAELRPLLEPAGQAFLDDRLIAVGWLEPDDELPPATRFSLGAVNVYEVGMSFPRLTESSLPAGVIGVSYDLDLSVCAEYRIAEERLKELFNG